MTSSPCIQVCQIDEATRLCRGCGRSLREIGGWSVLAEDERLRIMSLLPERLAALEPLIGSSIGSDGVVGESGG